MRYVFLVFYFFLSIHAKAQFSFSGQIDAEEWDTTVYLSVVEDYRKLSGIYTDQVIAKTKANAKGFFQFNGNLLEKDNRIYRIHIDKCSENQQEFNHFNGYCEDSMEFLFIANNTDTLELPASFDNQLFCLVESNNPKADAFLKIDSLKNEMRFAYSEVRSEASKKLNNKKWFKTFQDFGEQLEEPLAELAIYSYLSDRRGELHNFYLEDLRNNTYYAELRTRLEEEYPNSSYTNQYKNEVEADLFRIEESLNTSSRFSWTALLSVLLFISIGINIIFLVEKRKQKQTKTEDLKANLSKQEQVVLELILENKSNKDIAEALFLSVSTVKSHTNNIYKKLDVNSRSDVKSLFSK